MDEYKVKKHQIRYFENISETLNIQQLAAMIQFGGSAVIDENSFAKREMKAHEIVVNSLKEHNCNLQNALEKFEHYKKALKSVYLEVGIQTGICLQTELLAECIEDTKEI